MNARKNKVLSKGKTKMVKPNNQRHKTYDKANHNSDEASPKPEASPGLEASSDLDEASPSPEEVTLDPDMRIDLAPEWAEYEEEYSSDQVEIPEGINHSEKF